uniref:Bystin n=1 Tax=Rhizophora mucronata TaxID=61149 RepID=A0A2P2MG36_RHIMU
MSIYQAHLSRTHKDPKLTST